MSERTLRRRPSARKLATRRLLQQFGVHPRDPEAAVLDLRGCAALCIATNHAVLDIGVATGGPLGLLKARTSDGDPLVKGRRVTAVTDKQIRELGIAMTPLHPETALRRAGARFDSTSHSVRDFFANHFVADGDLITGQHQNAGPMVARLMMQRVLAKQPAGTRVAS